MKFTTYIKQHGRNVERTARRFVVTGSVGVSVSPSWTGALANTRRPLPPVLNMPAREEYLQETRFLQGGILSALSDTAAAYALLPGLPKG